MTVTTIDRMTALIVVDMQKGIAIPPTVHPLEVVVSNTRDLVAAFRSHDLPVVLVNVAGGAPGRSDLGPAGKRPEGWTELIPELDQQPSDIRVTKFTWGAFTGTGLHEILTSRGVTQVVVAGIATSMGVESTARQAHELGFNVTVAIDAITDRNVDVHENSVGRVFPKMSESGTVAEILTALDSSRGPDTRDHAEDQ